MVSFRIISEKKIKIEKEKMLQFFYTALVTKRIQRKLLETCLTFMLRNGTDLNVHN